MELSSNQKQLMFLRNANKIDSKALEVLSHFKGFLFEKKKI
jgi:hypothetical protein